MNPALQFEFLAAAVGVFALVILYLAYRFLASSSWVMGWIQGNLGLGLLLLTAVLVLAIMDIRTYRPMFENVPIATLSLHTLGPDQHQLRLVNNKGIEQSYPIEGDEYQLVINQFKWATRFSGMGMGHGYRVDHIVNIHSNNAVKTKVPVSASDYLDVWRFFHKQLAPDFLISAHIVKTAPRKVVDGGMYELIPDAFDVNVVPLNQVAKEADIAPITEVPVETVPVTTVNVPADAPVAAAPVVEAPVPKTQTNTTPAVTTSEKPKPSAKPKAEEMPGAHLQATPATLIEKPAEK